MVNIVRVFLQKWKTYLLLLPLLLPLFLLFLFLRLGLHTTSSAILILVLVFSSIVLLSLRLLFPSLSFLPCTTEDILVIHVRLLWRFGAQIYRRLLSSGRSSTTGILAFQEVVVNVLALLLPLFLILLQRSHEPTAASLGLIFSRLFGFGIGFSLSDRIGRLSKTFVPVIAALLSFLAFGSHVEDTWEDSIKADKAVMSNCVCK